MKTAEGLKHNPLPTLKKYGFDGLVTQGLLPMFADKAAYDQLVEKLSGVRTEQDMIVLNNDLVAMQKGEVLGSSKAEQTTAMNMSFLLGFATGVQMRDLKILKLPKIENN